MKKVRTCVSLIAVVAGFVGVSLFALPVQAANPQEQICAGTGGHLDGNQCVGNSTQGDLTALIGTIVNVLLYLVGIIAVIVIIIGAIRYVTSAGDASKVKGAKDTILYAVIGIVVAVIAYAIVNFVVGAF